MHDLVQIAIFAAAIAICVIALRMRPLISAIEIQTKSLNRMEETLLLSARTPPPAAEPDDPSEEKAHGWLTDESS